MISVGQSEPTKDCDGYTIETSERFDKGSLYSKVFEWKFYRVRKGKRLLIEEGFFGADNLANASKLAEDKLKELLEKKDRAKEAGIVL